MEGPSVWAARGEAMRPTELAAIAALATIAMTVPARTLGICDFIFFSM
jgi:hypothetical protein